MAAKQNTETKVDWSEKDPIKVQYAMIDKMKTFSGVSAPPMNAGFKSNKPRTEIDPFYDFGRKPGVKR